jgi:medium-chain acyl-[acyl-carrier-protein] hydrolase
MSFLADKNAGANWHPYHKPNPEAVLRMFCFPYAGGSAAIFRSWQSRLPSLVEVYPVELPGRGVRWREPAISRLPALVESIASAIIGKLNKPFVLFGHSMGALLCYELAQYLGRYHDLQAAHLVVSGCPAPDFVQDREQTYALADREFSAKLRELNGTPPEILEDTELMKLLLPTLRADFTIVDTYQFSPTVGLSCPITVMGGLDDPELGARDLLGWQDHTSGSFCHHMFPGDHFFIRPSQERMLAVLRKIVAMTPEVRHFIAEALRVR